MNEKLSDQVFNAIEGVTIFASDADYEGLGALIYRNGHAILAALRAAESPSTAEAVEAERPRVTDDDRGEITISRAGKELRGWSYKDDAERRTKMLCAREYIEGWCDGRTT